MTLETAPPLILAENLTRVYKLGYTEVVGIRDVNMRIGRGEFVVLKGNSGSGKSTLLALLAGLDQPTSGSLTAAGQNLQNASPSQLTRYRRETVGMIFQSFNLLPTLTVLENACLPGLLAAHPYDEVTGKALELLNWLNLSQRRNHFPAQLSGGEMQRTAIARALINDPAIILADEPTGNLDSSNGHAVIELLASLNRDLQRTIFMATHSSLADDYSSIQINLKDGIITEMTCKS